MRLHECTFLLPFSRDNTIIIAREGAECGKIHVFCFFLLLLLLVFCLFLFFRRLSSGGRSPHYSLPLCRSGHRDCYSAEKASVSTGVLFLQKPHCIFFVVYFFWKGKAFRLLYRGLQINPIICSKNLVTNQHQLEPSRNI